MTGSWSSRRALGCSGAAAALLALAAAACEPQDIYLFDRARVASTPEDAGVQLEEAVDEAPPDARPAAEPEGAVQPGCESEACEACLERGACAASAAPLCHPVSGRCVAACDPTSADDASDCAGATRCDPEHGVCVECLTRGDCSASPTPACDQPSGTCVECLADTDCSGARPFCDTSSSECVECRVATDCGPGLGACVEARCVECDTDDDCQARDDDDDDDDDLRCLDQRCAECLSNADCAAIDPDKPLCSSELECEDELE